MTRNPRRPFSPVVLDEGRKLAEQYQVVVLFEDGEWCGRGLELPHVFGGGTTAEACVQDTREALVCAVATLLEQGHRPPAPATTGQRTEQLNIRLTAEERLLLEAAAKRKGYSGMSDFIRAVAVDAANKPTNLA